MQAKQGVQRFGWVDLLLLRADPDLVLPKTLEGAILALQTRENVATREANHGGRMASQGYRISEL
jgi:hypothetical protein